ncbi:helix-turn-helix transcriptional regulator [Saccharothrix lopnurensis]|uniref:Helix-turn-helix transcriptional regulator n=1 Tax=Saccharothrix lopnurensis TaxID=1670621 RepID=A0ABW1P675_9PSEU
MYEGAAIAVDLDELLTPRETAEVTKLSVSTLKDRRWKGTGPAFIKLSPGRGGRIRYRRSDVVAWLAAQRVGVA